MEPTPHDALFRGIFGQPEHAAAELACVLPPELLACIDCATLEPLPATFVDACLAERHADLLFEAKLRGGGSALLLVLVEHQSGNDPWMALRLLGYQLRIWEQWRRVHPEAKRLPPIVPVVVHHGSGEWTAPRTFRELLEWGDEAQDARRALLRHHLDFELFVDDWSGHEPAALAARAMGAVARLAMVALRSTRDDTEFERQLGLLARLWFEARCSETGRPSVELVLRYLFELRKRPELRELARRAEAQGVDLMERKVVSWAEEARQEGAADGARAARRQIVRQLASQRFGALSQSDEATIDSADDAALERALQRLLSARSFAELFAR
ncbi:MAG: Rpn family recombination-promoting nuclease/putative transposase [Planctomycetes bacterium]|nr:Rpn family recombination-promoting nuclease/putative transposase [Planctomycetota bacterium]